MADINLLVVSVGNSRTALGAFVSGELRGVVRVDNSDREGRKAELAKLWEAHLKGSKYPACAGASVNPSVAAEVEADVEAVVEDEINWVGPELELPIEVKTEEPSKTGVDRVLAVAAAYEQLGKACVVVDAGTMVTVNVCDDAGNFLGGAIAPGVKTQMAAMKAAGAQLPAVGLSAAPTAFIGKNTESAMQMGVYHGIRGMVKELLESYATELGNWPELIATGGDAEVLFGGWELTHAISPDLVLYGVALAYADHVIKHQVDSE